MATFNERRSYQRCADQASILLSFFNKEDSFKARMINHSFGGVCIKSNSYFQPGTAILIRIKEFASDHLILNYLWSKNQKFLIVMFIMLEKNCVI